MAVATCDRYRYAIYYRTSPNIDLSDELTELAPLDLKGELPTTVLAGFLNGQSLHLLEHVLSAAHSLEAFGFASSSSSASDTGTDYSGSSEARTRKTDSPQQLGLNCCTGSSTKVKFAHPCLPRANTAPVSTATTASLNESTKVQTLGVFLGLDRSMSWKQRCYVTVSYVSM